MQSLINQYNDNTIWEVLVTYDFSNKNHKDFAPLFTHVKHKLTNLDINDGIYNFYEWKKAHRLFEFFQNIEVLIPKESQNWLKTQTNKLWDIIASEEIKLFFRKIKSELNNNQLNLFFKNIFGLHQRNSEKKEKIITKIDQTSELFEANSLKSKAYFFFPKSKKYLLKNFSGITLKKAEKKALTRNWNGYLFKLDKNTVYLLLTYIEDRKIREEIYNKFINSMNNCKFQIKNQQLLNKGLILKKKLANIYGFENYTDLVISKYLLTENQTKLLLNHSEEQINSIMTHSNFAIQDMFHKDGHQGVIEPWDYSYYQRVFRAKYIQKTNFEDYFIFNKTFPKILKQMEKVFNVKIAFIKEVNSNLVYKIVDNVDSNKISYWVVSPFSKKNQTPYEMDLVNSCKLDSQVIPWIQYIYLNINKKQKMSFYNVKDTIHEIGHAFHSFFSKNEKMSTKFGWDLIELPSQFLENKAYSYDFLQKITSAPYFSKKVFNQEIKNYTFNDIFYFKERLIEFKSSFYINKDVNKYSNKKLIKKTFTYHHSVGNYSNPFYETEHFSNKYESDYFSNYVYFFSENIAKGLNLIYKDNDFRKLFKIFDLDKKSFKDFLKNKVNIEQVDLHSFFNYNQFNK